MGNLHHLGAAVRTDVIHGVQAVFLCAAPIAAIALGIVLLLREVPLAGRQPSPSARPSTPATRAVPDGGH